MKKLTLLFTGIFLLLAVAFGQNTTAVTPDSGTVLADHWGLVIVGVLALYEIIIRKYPTVKNWSILSVVMKLIDGINPNNKTDGTVHK